jgi:hypothetical protein
MRTNGNNQPGLSRTTFGVLWLLVIMRGGSEIYLQIKTITH